LSGPLTDQKHWELSDSGEKFELKEAALNAATLAIYNELIVRTFSVFLMHHFLLENERRDRKGSRHDGFLDYQDY
jgi:hypothetical protein